MTRQISFLLFSLFVFAACSTDTNRSNAVEHAGPNTAPSISGAQLSEGPHYRFSTITVVPLGWSDAEGDRPHYTYQWFVNDAPVAGETTAEFQPSKLAKNDRIRCQVTPSDGLVAGAPVFSNETILAGSPPEVHAASLVGGPFFAQSVIKVDVWAEDRDGDEVSFSYQWFVNGSPRDGATGPSLSGVKRSDEVFVRVTPYVVSATGGFAPHAAVEAAEMGLPVDSNTVTIFNTPPMPPASVEVYPSLATSGTGIWAVVAAGADADGDQVYLNYDWYKNGELQQFPVEATAVPGDYVEGGDDWVVVVSASDLHDESWAALAAGPMVLFGTGEKMGGAYHTCVRTASKAVMKCWGENSFGQLGLGSASATPTLLPVAVIPGGASNVNVNRISLGHYHTCVVLATAPASVRCWGRNDEGQLGRGTTSSYETDFGGALNFGGATISDVASGSNHSCARTSTGDVWCWGGNGAGQVGDASTATRTTPVLVLSTVSQIAAGEDSTCAVTSTPANAVYCWGRVVGSTSPVQVAASGYSTAAGSLGVTSTFACGRSTSSELRCWGGPYGATPVNLGRRATGSGTVSSSGTTLTFTDDQYLQTGQTITSNGQTRTISSGSGKIWVTSTAFSPVLPAGSTFTHLFTVLNVNAGLSHVCVLTGATGLKCLGGNSSGQLGTGVLDNSDELVDVPNFQKGVKAVSVGANHTCAAKGVSTGQSGTIFCWGDNSYGQLGIGTAGTIEKTAVATSGFAAYIDGGDSNSCLVTNASELKCWGDNTHMQLGNNTVTTSLLPTSVMADATNTLKGVSAIATGRMHACAVLDDGKLYCWGRGVEGQIGIAAPPAMQGYPVLVGTGYAAAAAGARHTCAILDTGAVQCWGDNTLGALGNGTRTSSVTPVAASIGTAKAISIAAGVDYTCIATATGNAMCWGANAYGQIGNGTTSTQPTPVSITIAGQTIVAVAAHDSHTCALTKTGATYCWGKNSDGQLGIASFSNAASPQSVNLGAGFTAAAVVVGYSHSCALSTTGSVKCWGRNADGEVGDGTTTVRNSPTSVSYLTNNVVSIGSGGAHVCAITLGGVVRCWGRNDKGQLGNNTSGQSFTVDRLLPVQVSIDVAVSAIGAGAQHTCDVNGGTVKCWGNNVYGQSGPSAASFQSTSVSTGLGSGASVEGGENHSCALLTTGAVWCWGNDAYGQLGNGAGGSSSSPQDTGQAGMTAIAVNGYHGCAVNANKGIQCWGAGGSGQLGNNSTANQASPSSAYRINRSGVTFTSTGGGDGQHCGIQGTAVRCWGKQDNGTLGNGGTSGVQESPVGTSFGASTIVAAGDFNVCAAQAANGVQCAGDHWEGANGNGNWTGAQATPVAVTGLPASVPVALSGGYRHFCTVASTNLYCWGWNAEWQVGKAQAKNCNWGVTGSYGCCTCSCWCGCCWWCNETCYNYGWLDNCDKTAQLILTGGVTDVSTQDAHTCAIQSGVLKCWGRNSEGQIGNGGTASPVASLYTTLTATVTKVAVGGGSTCAVQNSVLKCTGRNDHGELGNNSTTQSSSWVNVNTSYFTGGEVSQLTAGDHHVCALVGNPGIVYCWGGNWEGMVGDGTTTGRAIPVPVQDLYGGSLNYVTHIDAGRYSTCAVRTTGQTVCWGWDNNARLGNNENGWATEVRPRDVNGYSSEVYTTGTPYIDAGGSHTCFLVKLSATDVGVRCFGANESGQLGDNSTTGSAIQRNVLKWDGKNWVNAFTRASSVAAGFRHSCAVENGVVNCWGNNEEGQLGNGTVSNSAVPVVVSGSQAAVQVVAGGAHTCALVTNPGAVRCWGRNAEGQLGDGSRTSSLIPVSVSGVANAVAITAGRNHTCALISGGTVKCWGAGDNGQIGVDATPLGYVSTARDIAVNSGTAWTNASLGQLHGCGIVGGAAKCWGDNMSGQVGDANASTAVRSSPAQVAGLTANVIDVGTGQDHSCALVTESGVNVVKCWGGDGYGQLGSGSYINQYSPVAVPDLLAAPDALAVGRFHTCVRLTLPGSGLKGLECWGENSQGQLGTGDLSSSALPRVVTVSNLAQASNSSYNSSTRVLSGITFSSGSIASVTVGSIVTDISTGGQRAVTAVGGGNVTLSATGGIIDGGGFKVADPLKNVSSVKLGTYHSCAILTTKNVMCWGANAYGQLGANDALRLGGVYQIANPTYTLTSGGTPIGSVAQVTLGDSHTCVLQDSTWGVTCYGSDEFGQIGDNATTGGVIPYPSTAVSGLGAGVSFVGAAGNHTCAVLSSGTVRCWGDGSYGQLGNGAFTIQPTPVTVNGVFGSIDKLAVGITTVCAHDTQNNMRCWGDNSMNQVGNRVPQTVMGIY